MKYILLLFILFGVVSISGQVAASDQTLTPVYPADALAKFRGKERIDLFLEIDKNGHVKNIEAFGPWIMCGKDDNTADALRAAAVKAAKQSVFTPVLQDGKPVEGVVTASYSVEGTMPPPAKDTTKQVTGGVVNGQRISMPSPKYPLKALKFGIQGPATIVVLIDEEGKPIDARAKSGHPLLLASAAQAACNARWTPTLLAGNPVKVSGLVTYNFKP